MRILTVPEETEILRTKSRPVGKIDAEPIEFLRELGETLKGQKDPAGVGLSAIQVGKPIRAFATLLPPNKFGSAPHYASFGSWATSTQPKSASAGFERTSGFLQNKNPGQSEKTKPELKFYINPEIAEHAAEMTLGQELTENRKQRTENRCQKPFLEGCLSIPRIYGAVLRWPWIKVKYQILSGVEVSDTLQGLQARVFQHELDHLNGILFTDLCLAQGNKLYREKGKEMVEMEM